MQRWLNHAGNPATDLHAARILGGSRHVYGYIPASGRCGSLSPSLR
jgi:hypothetical protein